MQSSRALRVAAVAASLAGSLSKPEEFIHEFDSFVHKFEKKFEDETERALRFKTFQDNYQFILSENDKGHSYKLGINEFADMTLDEFSMTRLGLRVPRDSKWGNLPSLGTHVVDNTTALPASIDWVAKGGVTPVKNQGQCGSCWAFSTTGALEGAWHVATGKLLSLSEQQLIDCAKKFGEHGCSGGLMDNAFRYAENSPICEEQGYPYKEKEGICQASTCSVGIPAGGVVGFRDVATDSAQALMSAVAQQPVSLRSRQTNQSSNYTTVGY